MQRSPKSNKRADQRRKQRRALAVEQAVFDKLREVRAERESYDALNRRIVEDVLQRIAPLDQGPIVEIGAGDGQLYPWVPEKYRRRIILTEPTRHGAEKLARRLPESVVLQASSDHLPFEAGEVALVVGLCVFDVIEDLQTTIAELDRVLRPGAAVIHLLDQNPFLKPLFQRLLPLNLALLPNILGDPCASSWPEDILCVEVGQLQAIVATLRKNRHPIADPLARYLKVFQARPLALEQSIAEFDEISKNPKFREALSQGLRAAYQLATPEDRRAMGEFSGHLLSSSLELGHRLRSEFAKSDSFDVEYCDVVTAAELEPTEAPLRYMSVCAGQHRALQQLPTRCLVEPQSAVLPGELLREAGMMVFVARKRGAVPMNS